MYIWQRRKKVEYNKAAVTPVTPVPVALSSDASEWIEIAQDVFFSKKTGELKDRDHKVFLARNRLRAFICFWEAPDHTVSYPVFCNDVLGRPLSEDESTEENRQQNRAIKKSMTQTIMRLREDLTTFPELSIENASGLSYRLNIGTVRRATSGWRIPVVGHADHNRGVLQNLAYSCHFQDNRIKIFQGCDLHMKFSANPLSLHHSKGCSY